MTTAPPVHFTDDDLRLIVDALAELVDDVGVCGRATLRHSEAVQDKVCELLRRRISKRAARSTTSRET